MADRLFLVLEQAPQVGKDRRNCLRFAPSLADVRRKWKASTRISPVVPDSPKVQMPQLEAMARASVVFVGPCAPQMIPHPLRSRLTVFHSLGAYNLVLIPSDGEALTELLRWLSRLGQRYECWSLKRGVVHKVAPSTQTETRFTGEIHRSRIPKLEGQALGYLADEYEALIASAFARSGFVEPKWAEELTRLHRHVLRQIAAHRGKRGELEHAPVGLLLQVNAALSRFSSQAFSGSSPIESTECHFWTHSLLGTGLANLGLWRLCRYILVPMEQQRRPQRLAATRRARGKAPDLLGLSSDDPYWSIDQLGATRPARDRYDRLGAFPVVTFFSGRDGFHATQYSVSAPLAAVERAAAASWTLHTITHELTHQLVTEMLSVLVPKSIEETAEAVEDLGRLRAGLFAQIRRHLIATTLISYQIDTHADFDWIEIGATRDPTEVFEILHAMRMEIEELLVAVVDYLHFYGATEKALDAYLRGVWTSWSALPNLAGRVEHYVLRSLCVAMLSDEVGGGEWTEKARKALLSPLKRCLKNDGLANDYVKIAIDLLESEDGWIRLKNRLIARRGYVNLARAFFVSADVAERALADSDDQRQSSEWSAAVHRGDFFAGLAKNPLRLIERETVSASKSLRDSVWLYNQLAFGLW